MTGWIAMGAASLALVAIGTVAGISLAGPNGITEPRPVTERVVLDPVTATKRVAPGRAVSQPRGTTQRRRRPPVINFFYQRVPLEPGFVQPIRCPRRAGRPIGGGARTSVGIVVSYLSRVHPTTNETPRRTYFVGVDALEGADPAANAYIEVACAKRMKVLD